MKLESILKSAVACFLTLALSVVAFGQDQNVSKDQINQSNQTGQANQANQANQVGKQPNTVKNTGRVPYNDHVVGTIRDEEKHSKRTASLLREFMRTPDKGIPQSVFGSAECVAVFPNAYRSGSVVSERGMISCRTRSGWSAPVYLNLSGGALSSQVGPEPADVVMMFMNRDIVTSLSNGKFTIGADAQASAGPPATGAAINAPMICYSRSKGEVAVVTIDGPTIEVAQDDMRDVYGNGFNPKEIMEGSRTNAPSGVMAFSQTLSRYTSRQARK